MRKTIVRKIKTAPKTPGIYIFYQSQIPLYIGKASNLKNRLQSYLKITDIKTETLHAEADKLKLLKLRSNIEALIVESRLIKTLSPKLNVLWRDDKNYFYVAITEETFPKIYITHQPTNISHPTSNHLGPFTDGQSIKAILRLLRKFFPYCSCFQPHLRLCLNAQIGNCPGYCCQRDTNILMRTNDTNNTNIKNYQKNIRKIKNILTGKDKKFIGKLKDPYELLVLEKIWAHEPYLDAALDVRREKLDEKKFRHPTSNLQLPTFQRIECYDNSHLSGKEAVGAMTAWKRISSNIPHPTSSWISEKSLWRKFKIRGRYTEDDPRMMEEVVRRRLNHPEWPYPDLIIIDGGITQLNAAQRALQAAFLSSNFQLPTSNIKLISYAKPRQLVFGLKPRPVPVSQLPEELKKLTLLAIDRTHNYAQSYHRQVRQKNLVQL